MGSPVTEEASAATIASLFLDVIAKKPLDFDSWVSLISHVEKLYGDDEGKICSIYDSFLSEFPLCYGYWRKYVAHMIRLSTLGKIILVFEQAVQAVTHSIDVWLDYCVFCTSIFPDPNDVRRQFKRGLSHVGRDYLCYTLWDKYIEFEFSQQNWSALAYIHIQILRYPKKMLHDYYNRFTQLVAMFKEEMERQGTFAAEICSVLANELPAVYTEDEILGIIKDLLDESNNLSKTKAWHKYKLLGECLHAKSCLLDEKIHCFEDQVHKTYFHIKPLDRKELENWHQYLDFVEEQGDFDWAVKIYERCLIPCAQYTDFWIRYVQFLERDGGRELANFALDRATKTFLKPVPSIHLFNARYKEQIGDFNGARTTFPKLERKELHPSFINSVIEQANMERRLGNFEAAYHIYREAIELTTERKKMNMLSCLYMNYSRLTYTATKSVSAALGILADGIKQIPNCKLLLKELIKFGMMHGDLKDMNLVDTVVATALTSKESLSFSLEEKQSMSSFYLKFVDLCGTIGDLMKAWARHIKLFPDSVRTASNEGPSTRGETEKVAASKAIDLCTDAGTSTHMVTRIDEPDQLQAESQTEPIMRKGPEGSRYACHELENGSLPIPNNMADASSADLTLQDIHKMNAMKNTKPPYKLSDFQHDADNEDEHNVTSLDFGNIAISNGGKRSPNATTTMDKDGSDLEDVSRKITEENISISKSDLSLPRSLMGHRLHGAHGDASSDSGLSVRGDPLNDDQNLLQRLPSPAGTPRSVPSYVLKSHEDPPSTPDENSTQHSEGNPENTQDWDFRRRPDRFIKDPSLNHRPKQRRPSPPKNFRSDSDHIITIQRNAAQPLPMNTQPVQNNPIQYQQPWMSTPFSAAMGYSLPMQNMQQTIPSASQAQLPFQPVDQASSQMPQYTVQVGNQTGHIQNQQMCEQMMQNYYYQQQALLQQQQLPQQFQASPDQWQQQQQQYWMQLQYQQQHLAQGAMQHVIQPMPVQIQQQVQVPLQMQQLQEQGPFQMQQQTQAPLQMQQQAQPVSPAPLLHQQQLQQLLELQQLRKQQQQQQQQQDNKQPEKVLNLQQLAPSSSDISI